MDYASDTPDQSRSKPQLTCGHMVNETLDELLIEPLAKTDQSDLQQGRKQLKSFPHNLSLLSLVDNSIIALPCQTTLSPTFPN